MMDQAYYYKSNTLQFHQRYSYNIGQDLVFYSIPLLMLHSVLAVWNEQLKMLSMRVGIWAYTCASFYNDVTK